MSTKEMQAMMYDYEDYLYEYTDFGTMDDYAKYIEEMKINDDEYKSHH